MPYPNEHACRLHPPGRYESFRRVKRKSASKNKTHSVIRGKTKSDGSWEDQAYRYPKSNWTSAQARSHCEAHGGTFEAAAANAAQEAVFVHSAMVGYTIRHETFEGRDHVVAPVVMLVEGVHHGSGGPVYYPADELAAFTAAWNGRPVVVYHPEDFGGQPISANSPGVLQAERIGYIFNAEYVEDGAKLRAEVWLDISRTEEIAPMVLATINAGRSLELSTGLFFEADGVPGVWNGEEFESTVYNYRPDHLALLPGEVGACSVADGCGVRANQDTLEDVMTGKGKTKSNPDPARSEPGTSADSAQNEPEANADAFDKDNATPDKGGDAPHKRLTVLLGELKEFGPAMTINRDLSHNTVWRLLQQAINPLDSDRWMHYVEDVYDDYFIYEARGHEPATGAYACHYYMRKYTIDEAGTTVTLDDAATEVIRETTYIPVPAMAANQRKEKQKMSQEIINALIANEQTRFVECDRDWLKTLSAEQLGKLEPVVPANNEPKTEDPPPEPPKTAMEFAETAPEGYRDEVVNALKAAEEAKGTIVKSLLANSRNRFTEDELKAKPIGDLQRLAELGAVEANYEGKGGGPSGPDTNAVPKLGLPTHNEKKAEAAA